MTTLVLDASASVELLLDTTTGRALQEILPVGAQWWVPEHFFVEVAGALRRAEIRQVVTPARIATAFEDLTNSPLRRVQVRPLLPEAWSRRRNLTIPDALDVEEVTGSTTFHDSLAVTLLKGDPEPWQHEPRITECLGGNPFSFLALKDMWRSMLQGIGGTPEGLSEVSGPSSLGPEEIAAESDDEPRDAA